MISPECFYEQYKHAFCTEVDAPARKSLLIAEQLLGFYTMAADLRSQELPPLSFVTMSSIPSFPVEEQNVLVPISGGKASTACLWWALKQGYTPWLFFADGFNPAANSDERTAVRQLMLCTCDQQGLPLCNEDSTESRLVIRPYPYEHSDDPALRMAMLYFMTQEVARSRGCCRIIWGALDIEQQVLRSLAPFFNAYSGDKGTQLVRSFFPFSSPEETMTMLQEAQLLSHHVQQMAEAGERLSGAALCADLRELCHSCKGPKQLPWRGSCSKCANCIRWSTVSMPNWRWNGVVYIEPLDSWKPRIEGDPRPLTPSWTCNVKRLAVQDRIQAKRLKEAEVEEEEAMHRAQMAKNKGSRKKPKKTKPSQPSKSAGKKSKTLKTEIPQNFFSYMDDDGPVLGNDEDGNKKAETAEKDNRELDDADGFDAEDEDEEEDEEEGEDEFSEEDFGEDNY